MKYPSVETLTQVIIGMGILIGLVVVGTVIVQRFRSGMVGNRISESELFTNFQEMRSRGDITEADYRRIKSVLGAKLHREVRGAELRSELKDDKETG